jgi:molecular chaperone GrpE
MGLDNGPTEAGADRPQPGFTFADKRKLKTGDDDAPVGDAGDLVGDGGVTGAGAASGGSTPGAAGAEPEENERLAAERLDQLQRLQAEYANYRRRVERDRAVARELAIGSVVESLLPVLDDIHLARQHGDLEGGPFAGIAEKLETTLGKFGVERFGEPGTPFDPAVHDALMHVDEELAEGTDVTTVVGVLQPGYRIGERIVRPARVSVADPR